MTTNIGDIVDYYVNLLIIQYNQLPNARATIGLLVRELLANGIYFDVENGYDLNTAIGAQLDVLGKYIGVDRFFTTPNLTGYFSFTLYDDVGEIYGDEIGYANYSDFGEKPGFWLTYDGVLSTTYALSDADYRTLLRLKILQNNINSSDKEIDDGIFEIFGTALIPIDNYDMTMTYIVDSSISAIISVANDKGALPKPMGVGLTLLVENVVTTDSGAIVTTDSGDYVVVG